MTRDELSEHFLKRADDLERSARGLMVDCELISSMLRNIYCEIVTEMDKENPTG